MIVRDYFDDAVQGLLAVNEDLATLLAADANRQPPGSPQLLVWRSALVSAGLDVGLCFPTWPLDLLKGMPPGEWEWTLTAGDGRTCDPNEIYAATSAASGADGNPRGNVCLTLKVRGYEDRETSLGGIEWWNQRKVRSGHGYGLAGIFYETIVRLLTRAAAEGSTLFVEQVSIVLSKDADTPIASLTPTLHADQYYGVRESAITSLLERGWEGFGGAMFMPTCTMNKLWPLRPLTLNKIIDQLSDQPLMATNHGDVLIYDGMIGLDGRKSSQYGVPHISPDVPGRSSRLAILMYHQRTVT